APACTTVKVRRPARLEQQAASYAPGQEGQVDWYEAWAELNGAQVKLQVFSLRSMMSGAAFHRAYPRATQQAFFEAHEHAFHYFGGVFRLLRYDYVARHIIIVLCPSRLCCHHDRGGLRALRRAAENGHIMFRANSANREEFRHLAIPRFGGIPT